MPLQYSLPLPATCTAVDTWGAATDSNPPFTNIMSSFSFQFTAVGTRQSATDSTPPSKQPAASEPATSQPADTALQSTMTPGQQASSKAAPAPSSSAALQPPSSEATQTASGCEAISAPGSSEAVLSPGGWEAVRAPGSFPQGSLRADQLPATGSLQVGHGLCLLQESPCCVKS